MDKWLDAGLISALSMVIAATVTGWLMRRAKRDELVTTAEASFRADLLKRLEQTNGRIAILEGEHVEDQRRIEDLERQLNESLTNRLSMQTRITDLEREVAALKAENERLRAKLTCPAEHCPLGTEELAARGDGTGKAPKGE